MKKSFLASLIFFVVLGTVVSLIKYEVVFLKKKLSQIEQEKEECSDDLKVLRAEWSYLNNPERLKILCQKHLWQMKPIANSQIVLYNDLMRDDGEETCGQNALGAVIDGLLNRDRVGHG